MTLFPRINASPTTSWFSFYLKIVVPVAPTFSTNATLNPYQYVNSDESNVTESKPLKLKKFAVYFGYQGADYHGLTLNTGQKHVPTVGAKLLKAFINAGYMDESEIYSAKPIVETSRTDRGVSALRQIAAMMLPQNVDLEKVREGLPKDIRLFGLTRTTSNFLPFRYCCARSYLYYIPSYAFAPQTVEMDKGYRLDTATTDKIKNTLTKFIGSRIYHNFTQSRDFQDPRARRYIKAADLLDPIVVDGLEMACIRLHGDSFILNQIRKMVGAIVTVVRGYTPETLIDIAFSREGIHIPRAPPNGLLLENVYFDFYNKRYANTHEPLDWSKYESEVAELQRKILSDMVSEEKKYEIVKLWVDRLQFESFMPYNKEELSLNSRLEYDETLKVIRSESDPVAGDEAATLFI